jgi:hypothetical protein
VALGVRGKTVQNLLTQIPHAVWGALAGAILTLAGVVITNWSNNKRLKIQLRHDAAERNKEREVAMRRQVYLDAAKEVVKAPQYLATLPSKDLSRVETQTELSELFARVNQVHLVGQKETVEAVSVWSIGLTKSVFGLMQHVMPMQITRNEIERLNQEVEENRTKSADYLAQLVQRHLAGNLDEPTRSVINHHIEFHRQQFERASQERALAWGRYNAALQAYHIECMKAAGALADMLVQVVANMRTELGFETDRNWYQQRVAKQTAEIQRLFADFIAQLQHQVQYGSDSNAQASST